MLPLNQIYNEDCLIGMKKIPDGSVNLIVSDPPYGVDYKNDIYDDSREAVFSVYDDWLAEMSRVLKDGSHIYLFVPTLEIDKWVTAVKRHFTFKNILASTVFTTNRYLKDNYTFDLQMIIYASKGKANKFNQVDWIPTSESWLNDKRNKSPKPFTYQYPAYLPKEYRANVKPNAHKPAVHPNQKNAELIEKFIAISSNENEVVLEPFCGSGATITAAINLKRQFIGFELDPHYYNLITQKHLGEENVNVGS